MVGTCSDSNISLIAYLNPNGFLTVLKMVLSEELLQNFKRNSKKLYSAYSHVRQYMVEPKLKKLHSVNWEGSYVPTIKLVTFSSPTENLMSYNVQHQKLVAYIVMVE